MQINRITSRLLTLLLYPMALISQSAQVPPQTVTTTAPVVPPQTIIITTPRNGGKVAFTIPAQTLKPLTATVPAQTLPISLSGMTGSFSCNLSAGGSFAVNPDQSITLTGLTCTFTQAKP